MIARSVIHLWPAPLGVQAFLAGDDGQRLVAEDAAARFVDSLVATVDANGGRWESEQIMMRSAAEATRVAAQCRSAADASLLARIAMIWFERISNPSPTR